MAQLKDLLVSGPTRLNNNIYFNKVPKYNGLDLNLVFVGTQAQYNTAVANNQIADNTFVILTDVSDSGNSSSTTSVLGYAILGQMILG